MIMNTPSATFSKGERLCGKIRIRNLYATAERFVVWPLRVSWRQVSDESPTQVLVWAPKAIFKHAVDRNHMRRLMREAYRLNKHTIADQHVQVAFNYIDNNQQPFDVVERAVRKALSRIAKTTTHRS